jgi:hypothetical protein
MKSLLVTRQVTNPVRQGESATGSEFCVVVSNGGTKRKQRLLKVCYRASKSRNRRGLNLSCDWDNTAPAIMDKLGKPVRSLRTHQRQTGVTREHGRACTASAREKRTGSLYKTYRVSGVCNVMPDDVKKRHYRKRYLWPRETEGLEKGTGSLSILIVLNKGGESAPGEPSDKEGGCSDYGTVIQKHQKYQRQWKRCQQ